MKHISIVINLDTRPESATTDTALKGMRSSDFLIDGVLNKKEFFKDHSTEIILYVDYHEPIPSDILMCIMDMLDRNDIDSVTFNGHREYFNGNHYYPKNNDLNYLMAIAQARGDYVVHFDADEMAFLNDKSVVDEWLQSLDTNKYDYISYPSNASPRAVWDPAFDYVWASTRFLMFKRDTFQYDEILKCLSSSEYLYGKYGNRNKKCPWFEHIISLIGGGNRVWYPPIEYDRCIIFTWKTYKQGSIARLRNMSYEDVKRFVLSQGGIRYPNDVPA